MIPNHAEAITYEGSIDRVLSFESDYSRLHRAFIEGQIIKSKCLWKSDRCFQIDSGDGSIVPLFFDLPTFLGSGTVNGNNVRASVADAMADVKFNDRPTIVVAGADSVVGTLAERVATKVGARSFMVYQNSRPIVPVGGYTLTKEDRVFVIDGLLFGTELNEMFDFVNHNKAKVVGAAVFATCTQVAQHYAKRVIREIPFVSLAELNLGASVEYDPISLDRNGSK